MNQPADKHQKNTGGGVPYFAYKLRIDKYKDRYTEAYRLGLDTISDWLSAGPSSDTYTPSRQALAERCVHYSGIPNWHFTDCGSDSIQAALAVTTKPGDKVIIPAWGFIATPENIQWIGREVVFCDNGPDAMMCPESLAECIDTHPDAKVIMPVHLLGRVQDVEDLCRVIPDDMVVIEDAANAFYMDDPGCKPGYGDIVCYSFDIAKHPASTGTGGAVATSNKRLLDRMKEVTQQGFNKNRNGFIAPATKSSMDDTTARIIAEDMTIMDETGVRAIRRMNNKLFNEEIKRETLEGENTVCTGFGFFTKNLSAREAAAEFSAAGIGVSVYPCFPDMPAFEKCASVDYTYARRLSNELVIVPLHEYLTEENKQTIISVANKV